MFNLGKKCSKCKKKKPFSEFHSNKNLKDGRTNYCKPCSIEAGQLYRFRRAMKEKGYDPTKYTDRLLDYSESPDGRAYIGINKAPLMPGKSGHGFQGVLLQDSERKLIQCSECGLWFKQLTAQHLKSCCGLTGREYKKRHGLNLTQGLVSDVEALVRKKRALDMTEAQKKAGRANLRKGTSKAIRARTGSKDITSMQEFNSTGTCPEQLKARTIEFIHTNKDLPSLGNRGRVLAFTLKYRFGSHLKAFIAYGLPCRTRGRRFVWNFPDGDSVKIINTTWEGKEALYHLMLAKCPVLQEPT